MAKKDEPKAGRGHGTATRGSREGAAGLLREAMSRTYDSRTVYGDPVTVAGRTIIPAARISSGGGGGFGTSEGGAGKAAPGDEGAGMGHGMTARPIGYIEITGEGSRWRPAIDLDRIILAAAAVLVLWLLAKCLGRRRCRR